jgi:1,2-phenylacetyl-CoA epoxidase PaaB subunit
MPLPKPVAASQSQAHAKHESLRELMVVVPTDDVYRTHQLVWDFVASRVAKAAGKARGQDFQFAARSPGSSIMVVRSAHFAAPSDSRAQHTAQRAVDLPPKGAFGFQIELAAYRRRSDGSHFAVHESEREDWVRNLLWQHGLILHRACMTPVRAKTGTKLCKATGKPLDIVIPGLHVEGLAEVGPTDPSGDPTAAPYIKARNALELGIGRGKRFGLGMLRVQG